MISQEELKKIADMWFKDKDLEDILKEMKGPKEGEKKKFWWDELRKIREEKKCKKMKKNGT